MSLPLTLPHSVSPIDENHLLYGNFIGLQYAFQDPLDSGLLAEAIDRLLTQFPALSGRYDAKQQAVIESSWTPRLKTQTREENIDAVLMQAHRPECVAQPARKDVLRGKAPLSTFSLTQFDCGGSILGMAISHLLTDAAGFHKLMQHLSQIYAALKTQTLPPALPFITHIDVFKFGEGLSKTEALKSLEARKLPKPIAIKGLIGTLIKSLIIKAMDKSVGSNLPVRIHFTAEQIKTLKKTVHAESGEDWISTNTALCAHFTKIIAHLSYVKNIKTEMQIGQLLDLRGRYFEENSESQNNFIGNAILIHIDKAHFPDGLQNTSRGAIARYFQKRQKRVDAKDIKTRLNLLSDCLALGYTNPELDVKNPIISLNNQSKMPIYDIQFDGQKPLRIYPQDVGDNIMFFPAPDDGVEIYIRDIVNPGAQTKLLEPQWQNMIFDI